MKEWQIKKAELFIIIIVFLRRCVGSDVYSSFKSMRLPGLLRNPKEKDDFKLTRIRGGETYDQLPSRSDFSIGKDRELFHASIDFKWLVSAITNKATWISILHGVADYLHRLDGSYEIQCKYREQLILFLLSIRSCNSQCTLRGFKGSLYEAERASREVQRFIMFYIEQETPDLDISLSSETLAYRTALADPSLGSFINQNLIFMAGYTTHPYCKRIMKLVESSSERQPSTPSSSTKRKPSNYPLLVILSANSVPGSNNGYNSYGYSENLEWIATLSLEKADITPIKIATYLNKIMDIHVSRLGGDSESSSVAVRLEGTPDVNLLANDEIKAEEVEEV